MLTDTAFHSAGFIPPPSEPEFSKTRTTRLPIRADGTNNCKRWAGIYDAGPFFAPDFTNSAKADIITEICNKNGELRPGLDRRR